MFFNIIKKLTIILTVSIACISFIYIEDFFFNPYKSNDDNRTLLTVAVYPSLDKAYKALTPAFEKAHPDIKLKIRTLGFADHHNMLITTMAAGMGAPDVAAIEIEYVGQLCGGGGFVNLFEKPYEAQKYKNDFVSYKWAQASTDANHLYAMPIDIAPACIYYRKDVINKYNIDINKINTMEDVYELGKKVTLDTDGDNKIDQWLVPGADYIFRMILYSSPQRFFDEDGKPNLKTPLIKKAMYWAKKIRQGKMDANVSDWTNEWYALIKHGKVVYFPMGSWLNAHLREWIAPLETGKFRVTKLPALEKGMPGMNVNWGGSFLGITNQSQKKEAAWKFIQFALTRVDSQILTYNMANSFPSLKNALDRKIFHGPSQYLGGQKAGQLWISISKNIPDVNTDERDNIALAIVLSALTEVMEGTKTIDQALDDAQNELENRMRIL